ncbi:39S ribosomal protein L52, mitochondrial [Leptidea sinapis]|uniref:39S ribosomal protein L52, mitochondrial n=1 Tax=Leptidea sinapis TaxID=189913 RepID=UPI002146B0FE|nr:39S ribosomal protein L52, mitochondrial [Leptidea sinapis]
MLHVLSCFRYTAFTRSITCTSVSLTKQWRLSKGLSANKNAEGILTDGPDYTFLDGRPTPLLKKQKARMEQHQQYAARIVQLCSEVDFAKTRYANKIQAAQDERDNILRNRLKPKGKLLNEKHS